MTVADELHTALGPTLQQEFGPQLADLCAGLTSPLEDVAALVRDGDAPGWASALDVDLTPVPRWLGQWVGVVPTDVDPEVARLRVRSRPGWRRLQPASILAAAREWLTPGAHLLLFERDGGDAYALRLQVYASQTVDEAGLRAALDEAVPDWMLLTVELLTSATYQEWSTAFPGTYADPEGSYATYGDETAFVPGG